MKTIEYDAAGNVIRYSGKNCEDGGFVPGLVADAAFPDLQLWKISDRNDWVADVSSIICQADLKGKVHSCMSRSENQVPLNPLANNDIVIEMADSILCMLGF